MYLRAKTVKGDQYLYLVKSKWDPKKNSSKQEIIKYLGKATRVSLQDVPVEYRDNPKILSFISQKAGDNIKKNELAIKKLEKSLYDALTKGHLDKAIEIFKSYTKLSSIANFFENILKPVMHRIGTEWAEGKISIATEHVASNIARELVVTIQNQISKRENLAKVLICSPSGEEHNLGCNVLQAFLQSRGFRVFNLSPSVPAETILHFIETNNPDIVLISIANEDNIKTGQRLVNKINENYKIPVMVGGQAFEDKDYKFNAAVIKKESIEKIPKMIKQMVAS